MLKILMTIGLWPVVWYIGYFLVMLEQPDPLSEWDPIDRFMFLLIWVWTAAMVVTYPGWKKKK